MRGDPDVIRHLNAVLTNELTAINQYFLHSRMFRNWGFERLAKHEHDESIDEMKHADKLIAHPVPGGLPNLQDLHKLLIGENVQEALALDLKFEQMAHPTLRTRRALRERRRLREPGVVRGHPRIRGRAHRLPGDPARLITKVGLPNYLQSQMGVRPS
jgi:bacterioferritin